MNILQNIPLSQYTTFRIGGPVKFFIEVKTDAELVEAIKFAKDKNLPHLIIGAGSNLLVADKGFEGVAIKISFDNLQFFGNKVTVGAGVPFAMLVEKSLDKGLAGLEKASGLPGTVGGAIYGNAGCFGWETKDNIESVKILSGYKIELLDKKDCGFSYRSSIFKNERKGDVIIEATFNLSPIKVEERDSINETVKTCLGYRNKHQAGQYACAGSFFQNVLLDNVPEKYREELARVAKGGKIAAAYFIEQAGLKGKKIGGVQVSMEHANFLINVDNATAEDVIMLSSLIKQYVRREFGVQLKEEVQMVGF